MNTFEQNLTQLASQAAALAEAVRETGGGALTLQPAKSGVPTATVEGRLLHSAYDPIREAETWADDQARQSQPGDVIVVLGVGLLYHVEALRRRLPSDTPIVVPVPDLRVLHDACAARPLDGGLARVYWLAGTPEEMAHTVTALGRPLRLCAYYPAARLHAQAYAALEAALRDAIASTVSGRLHVAVVGPIYGGSLPIARYTATALESLGHRVTWLDHSNHRASYDAFGRYRDTRHRLTMQSRFTDVLSLSVVTHLAEDPPDLVLAIAQAPLTLAVLEHLRKKKFLTAMWFVENYRHLTYWRQLAGGYEYWFVIQQAGCREALAHAGARHVSYLPMAADPGVHRPLTLTPAEQAEYGADVSFVGAGYANRRNLLPRWLSNDWSFKVWGDEWDGCEPLSAVLQRNGTRIDTDTCIKVFNATAINLNLHSCSSDGLDPHADFVNPRTFELAACGAFQLVDERSLLPDLFTDGEMIRFRRAEEVPALIRTWLKDPAGRRTIAEAARQRVLRHHTYEHRMKELLAYVGMQQPDRIGAVLRGDRNAGALAARASGSPELSGLLRRFPADQRVELQDLAARIRARGAGAPLGRDELLILMLDSYRAESRDLA